MAKKGEKSNNSQAKLFNEIVTLIDGVNPKFPPLPQRFHVVESMLGLRELLVENAEARQVQYCDEKALAGSISRHCNATIGLPRYLVTEKQSREIARLWIQLAVPVPAPKPMLTWSEEGMTLHRLAFDPQPGGLAKCPLFAEILGRSTNSNALAIFLGSIFDPDSDLQQYLYLYGAGRNGKGALARLLKKFLGAAYHGENIGSIKDANRFWTSSFLNKRVVAILDCNASTFPQSGLFKSLTGGDDVRIEGKTKDAFSKILSAKFIICSNDMLVISSRESDLRRAIFCHLGPIVGDADPEYENKLWAEAPFILKYVQDLYAAECGPRREIKVEDVLDDLSGFHDTKFRRFFNEHFEATNDADRDQDKRSFVTPEQAYEVFHKAGVRNTREVNKHLEFWQSSCGVEVHRGVDQDTGKRTRKYFGLKLKGTTVLVFGRNPSRTASGGRDDS